MLSITVALYCPVLLGAPMRNCDVALLPTSLQCKSRSEVLAWYYANEQVLAKERLIGLSWSVCRVRLE